jgi:hypothetical protein
MIKILLLKYLNLKNKFYSNLKKYSDNILINIMIYFESLKSFLNIIKNI